MKQAYKSYSAVILLLAVLLGGCSVSKAIRQLNHTINGNWVLQTIVTEGAAGKPKDKIFNEADFGCFIGSEWKFNSRSNRGSYTIVDRQKDCPAITRQLSWSLNEMKGAPAIFVFKRIDDKNNPMDNDTGFSLAIAQLEKTTMKLKADIILDGHAAAIIYNFVKQ